MNARLQLEEEKNKQEYLENREELDSEYEALVAMNQTKTKEAFQTLMKTWSGGGGGGGKGYLDVRGGNLTVIDDDAFDGFNSTKRRRWRRRISVTHFKRILHLDSITDIFNKEYSLEEVKANWAKHIKKISNGQVEWPKDWSMGWSQRMKRLANDRKAARMRWSMRLKKMAKEREAARIERIKKNALKAASKVVVDYRPVMSAIITDYLFR